MGGLCSRSAVAKSNPYANPNGGFNHYNYKPASVHQSSVHSNLTPPQVRQVMVKQSQETKQSQEPAAPTRQAASAAQYGNNDDEFYDGIPRYQMQKSRSVRSIAKVSEVSSRLGRGAVEVLDNLTSSMTNLNPGGGFASTVATKGNELTILSFEVANTIVKGSSLMQSLSKRSIRHLKEEVLCSEGVQHLISKDVDELLRIVAMDKREELKVFSGEVVRFGNRCKDPQWHNLNRYFEKISRELTPQKQLKEEAEMVIQQLMTLVQYTAELYHELHSLDRFEQDYYRKRHEEDNSSTTQKGDGLSILRGELKSQKKQVKNLKKKSLWSRSLEEVMEKLVDIVHVLLLEIHSTVGTADAHVPAKPSMSNTKLGPAGLSLHYANIIVQIDTLVARSSSMPSSLRDSLYQSLPPSIKSALRSRICSFHVKEELSVADIKAEMEKTLQWLVPMATNTAKAHHGFGWVGEWANTGSELNRKPTGPTDVIQIETLYHADKDKTESYILEQLLWLHHLVSKSKNSANTGGSRSPIKSPNHLSLEKSSNEVKDESAKTCAPLLTAEDLKMLQDISKKKRRLGISKSQDFDTFKAGLKKHDRLSKSSNYSPARESKESLPLKRLSSGIPVIDFVIDKQKALDVIDRVNEFR
ncbi:protein PSK SIMULATOR 1-like [Rhodamnia argentea]|uniref:Protein PSK SIMULATOR 1-like n=1 Tax=Rhodamnia argentea TaxID=178133 RepID=A0A8B8QSQ6_9MYRT|nr:protein PSK SIMULATOR 1-like [Rhodamnia argentea]XP_048135010.1 protein PSK SIMULATOR 1-like [Rhodamnia argentea]XP_048135014.1 protein PSK SIMULATOR 1-like [Rhodamnia argentea]